MSGTLKSSELTDLLIEHDEITIALGEDGRIDVYIRGYGTAKIDTLDELEQVVGNRTRFKPEETEWKSVGPRGVVIKASPESDLYCVWVGSVDNAGMIGTRAELLAAGVSPARLARADRWGSSASSEVDEGESSRRAFEWNESSILVREQMGRNGVLARRDLGEFLSAKARGDEAAATGLLVDLEEG